MSRIFRLAALESERNKLVGPALQFKPKAVRHMQACCAALLVAVAAYLACARTDVVVAAGQAGAQSGTAVRDGEIRVEIPSSYAFAAIAGSPVEYRLHRGTTVLAGHVAGSSPAPAACARTAPGCRAGVVLAIRFGAMPADPVAGGELIIKDVPLRRALGASF